MSEAPICSRCQKPKTSSPHNPPLWWVCMTPYCWIDPEWREGQGSQEMSRSQRDKDELAVLKARALDVDRSDDYLRLEADLAASQAREQGWKLVVEEYRAAFQADEEYRKAVREVLDLSAGSTDELVAVANDLGAKATRMRQAILAADPVERGALLLKAREGGVDV